MGPFQYRSKYCCSIALDLIFHLCEILVSSASKKAGQLLLKKSHDQAFRTKNHYPLRR